METDQGMERAIPGLGAPIVNGVPQNGTPNYETWYSYGNWFLYNFNEKLMGVWRSEVFWDTNGAVPASSMATGITSRPSVLRSSPINGSGSGPRHAMTGRSTIRHTLTTRASRSSHLHSTS